jgi:cell filamentation protein
MNKYSIGREESEVLTNLLGYTKREEIERSEFEGFLYAEISLAEGLSAKTRFSVKYIKTIHKLALGHLYSFAGKLRSVNMSKGNFVFPSAMYLDQNMDCFEKEVLILLPNKYPDKQSLIIDIATVHAELLFIHPFREGNGRTARLLANLMVRKQGYDGLNFERITEEVFPSYVNAVQKAANKDYRSMIKIIELIF